MWKTGEGPSDCNAFFSTGPCSRSKRFFYTSNCGLAFHSSTEPICGFHTSLWKKIRACCLMFAVISRMLSGRELNPAATAARPLSE